VAVEALSPEEGTGAAALLVRAAGETEAAGRFDPVLARLAERLGSLRYELEDVAGELRGYLEACEDDVAGRLEAVEARLDAVTRLVRKHGGTVEAVLAHAERSRSRQAELLGSAANLAEVEAELLRAREERDAIAGELHAARVSAAPGFAAAVRERLRELAMADAGFEVAVSDREGGCGARGRDTVEFLLAPNPGMPLAPLREIASGGELSRVMLAILSLAHGAVGGGAGAGGVGADVVAGGAGEAPLLVFDEIDAGIGGHTARAVGGHLRALARGRQVLCITHLPQVAALGARHFTIVKDTSRSPAVTRVAALDGDGVLGELVRMLGADGDDRAARGHARELLKAA
jgi:DNA repair protein RecN (Recombination protein N)